MASSLSFFSPRPLNSSNGSSTTNHIGSHGHMLSIPQQQRLLLEAQQHNTMVGQEHLRQPRSLAPTFSTKPPVDVHNYYPCHVGTTHRMLSTMPQPYAIDGSDGTRAFAPIANPTHVGGHAQRPVPTYLAMPKHASSGTIAGFGKKKLKRKAMTAKIPSGPSTDVVLGLRINAVFGFQKNCQEVQMHIAKKKNTTMTPLLINEIDAEAAQRTAREINFFPLSLNHGLRSSGSEFSDYEMSSMFGGASDVEMDLSLNLFSSSGKSGIRVDLSLKL